jgi:hypothetical protein
MHDASEPYAVCDGGGNDFGSFGLPLHRWLVGLDLGAQEPSQH